MNTITVIGNVGRDPELKYGANGTPICKFSVADTIGKDDNRKTTWHDIVVFKELAESVAANVTKGNRVVITGRLTIETYEKKDGGTGKRVEIIGDDVALSIRFANSPVDKIAKSLDATVIGDEEPF
jgi:single-strand DNA-binding protein